MHDSDNPDQFYFRCPPKFSNHIYWHWIHTEFMKRICWRLAADWLKRNDMNSLFRSLRVTTYRETLCPKLKWKQECIPVGCVPPACWPYPSMHWAGFFFPSMHWTGGCLPRGGLSEGVCLGGVCPGGCLPRECLPRGMCVCKGVGGVADTLPQTRGRHPPVDRMTDRCKTLPCRNFVAGGNNV